MAIEKLMNNIQAIDENAYFVIIEEGNYISVIDCSR